MRSRRPICHKTRLWVTIVRWLSRTQQTHHQESLSTAADRGTFGQTQQRQILYQIRCPWWIQYCAWQREMSGNSLFDAATGYSSTRLCPSVYATPLVHSSITWTILFPTSSMSSSWCISMTSSSTPKRPRNISSNPKSWAFTKKPASPQRQIATNQQIVQLHRRKS